MPTALTATTTSPGSGAGFSISRSGICHAPSYTNARIAPFRHQRDQLLMPLLSHIFTCHAPPARYSAALKTKLVVGCGGSCAAPREEIFVSGAGGFAASTRHK